MGATGLCFGYLSGLGFPLEDEKLKETEEFYWRFVLMFPMIFLILRASML